MKSMQYPSGKIVQYEVDDAGRIKRVSSATKLYADLPASANPYTADGRITRLERKGDRYYIRVVNELAPSGTWRRVWQNVAGRGSRLIDVTDVVNQK